MASPSARSRLLVFAALHAWLLAPGAGAAVVVLSNRSQEKVALEIASPGAAARRCELAAGDILPVPVSGDVELAFDSGGARQRYRLRPYTAMALEVRDGNLGLYEFRIPAADEAAPAAGVSSSENPKPGGPVAPASPETDPRRHQVLTVPVMLLVDDDEPAAQAAWEKRLRRRLDDASAVFERACRVRFQAVSTGTWESDGKVADFRQSLREFERKVVPAAPACLAIGFTSQYEVKASHEHLGGTRGPLHPYILVREWSPRIGEPQRLEVLVHELGHFLGAVHVADPSSVMRPVLTDRRSNARDFPIRLDAVNTLIVYQVAEELRTRRVRSFAELSGPAKERLRAVYGALDKALPADKTAASFASLLDEPTGVVPEPLDYPDAVVTGTRAVVQAIASAAARREAAALSGDRLTESYVRAAAAAAAELPKETAGRAFLLGLGIGMDDSTALRATPVFGPFCRKVETDDQREARLRVLRQPTVAGRRDLAQHFFVSCALAEAVGPAAAEGAGFVKEVLDARRGSGFSFADLAADLAGVHFARRVADGKAGLPALASSFAVADYMPPVAGLQEGIPWDRFVAAYGAAGDERFQREVAALRARISALAGYQEGR